MTKSTFTTHRDWRTDWLSPSRNRLAPANRRLAGILLYIFLLAALIAVAVTAHASPVNDYQVRPISLTVWKGISPWGTNSDNVINYFVIDLTRGRSAKLRGIEFSVLGNEVLEDAVGIDVAGFGSVVGESMTGLQFAGLASVSGADMHGAQIGGLAVATGGNARWLQFGGIAAVAGGNVTGVQVGGLASVAGNDATAIQFGGLAAVAGDNATGAQAGVLAVLAGGGVRGAQVSGLAAVSGGRMSGVQAGGLAAVAGDDVSFLQFGGFAGVAGGRVTGVQAGGFAGVAGSGVKGMQFGGIAAVCSGSLTGIQVSGLASVAEGNVNGIQFSGLASVAGNTAYGLQVAGLANVAGDLRFAQIGPINAAETSYGVQLGLINAGEDVYGVQLGLINALGDDEHGLAFGAVTRTPGGPRKLDVWYSETGLINAAWRTGTRRTTAIVTVGGKPGDPYFVTFGAGTGYRIPMMQDRGGLEIEGLWQKVNEGEIWTQQADWVATARLLFSYQVTDRFGIFLGPTYNYSLSNVNDGADFAPTAADTPDPGNPWTNSWLGFNVGVRLF